MCRPTRQSYTSTQERCWQDAEDDSWIRQPYSLWALGTMAMGEGGPELVKQLLNKTYDIRMPGVIAVYLDGRPVKGVAPRTSPCHY